ncbi:exoribonuclease II [Enterobacteriaceae endosymbiont of Macroplea mutica]|uniref:exoribonuclease II n=1 Tax=Enterobacteriaceae endosymbiont of Macroplea mutica TaxID=2675791 RepID=UPI001448F1CD|nr:exoribonuclease II [Enterobacteriaceae endosymbiont of Macroplea mutica]QJC31069.1 exoribonuclease II [Enterobacteriaceae endosymbiont of Macroplea mutica]
MLRHNKILLQLKKKIQPVCYIKGIVKIIKNNIFLESKDGKIYKIPIIFLKKIMHGDYILSCILKEKQQLEVMPIKLLKSVIEIFIGKLKQYQNQIFIIPDNPNLYQYKIECVIDKQYQEVLCTTNIVIAKLIHHPLLGKDNIFRAKILEYLPEQKKYSLSLWHILSQYNINIHPPHNSLCDNIDIIDNHILRQDLTKLCFITIDNSDTKEIDDAIYIKEMSNKQLQVYVAIADPTAFFIQDSNIDMIALERMFTNYFPGFNIPLFPKYISENICSLLPMQVRSALICKIIINDKGKILLDKTEFFMGLIQSKAQLNYVNVSNWLENIGSWIPQNLDVEQQINLLYKIYLYRLPWHNKNIIFFNNPEYKLIINCAGNIIDIHVVTKRIAHKMVETIMIIANICAAEILYQHLGYGIYNIYYGFNCNKLQKITTLLNTHHINYRPSQLNTLQGYQHIYSYLKKHNLYYVINRLRKYQTHTFFNIYPGPHFGLGVYKYATWTSPLRKFGDVINHRLIKAIIQKKNIEKPSKQIIHHMNYKKYIHKQVENKITNFLCIEYCKNIINKKQIFLSEIIDILYIGLRVRLIVNGIYVLIPKNSIINNALDIINIIPEQGMVFVNNKLLYKVTDQVKVMLQNIDINNNIIAQIIY